MAKIVDGKNYKAGSLFAWGSTLYKATSNCVVWPGLMNGSTVDLVEFALDCDPELAVEMLAAVGADAEFLMIGSDTGVDEHAEDQSDEE